MTARLDAIAALERAIERLTSLEPITALDRRLLVTMLQHARERVESIEELLRKRKRKQNGGADTPPPILHHLIPTT